jgi:hypothetical protein
VSLLFRETRNTTLGIHTGVRYTRKDDPTHSLLAVKGLRPPRLRRVAVRGGGEEPRRGRGGERSGSDHHQTYRATRVGHPPNNTHPDQPPHSTPPYSDRDPTHPGLSQYSTLGTTQRRPIGRGSCFYGGECTMERSSSSRNCTRECATWSSVLLGTRKWIQKKKKKKLARAVVRSIRGSNLRREAFNDCINDGNSKGWFKCGSEAVTVKPLQLLCNVQTRWDSCFRMLEWLWMLRLVCVSVLKLSFI